MNADYLPLVMEEAGEIIQAIGKIQRFGPDHYWVREGCTNTTALAHEIGDFLEVVERLDLPKYLIERGRRRKRKRLEKYAPEVWRPDGSHLAPVPDTPE